MTDYTHFFHRDLWCALESISFPCAGLVRLVVPYDHCTDMTGAIKVAKSACRGLDGFKLTAIEVVSHGTPRYGYVLKDGKWIYVEAPR